MSVRAAWRVMRLVSASQTSRRGNATAELPAIMGRWWREKAEHEQHDDRDHDAAVGNVEHRPPVEVDEVDDVALYEPDDTVGDGASEDHADEDLAVPGGPVSVAEKHDVGADDQRHGEVQPVQLREHTERRAAVLDMIDRDDGVGPDPLTEPEARGDQPFGEVVERGDDRGGADHDRIDAPSRDTARDSYRSTPSQHLAAPRPPSHSASAPRRRSSAAATASVSACSHSRWASTARRASPSASTMSVIRSSTRRPACLRSSLTLRLTSRASHSRRSSSVIVVSRTTAAWPPAGSV